MPPSNDNYSNAKSCSVYSGSFINETNIGTTLESNEPLSHGGATTWYIYNAFSSSAMVFATYDSTQLTNGVLASPPQLHSYMTAYTQTGSGGVTSLKEVPYLLGNAKSNFGGFYKGSQLIFYATQGTNYYIRVDSALTLGVATASLVNGGGGFSIDDLVQVKGGLGRPATFKVTSEYTGSITGFNIIDYGDYVTNPSAGNNDVISVPSGSGGSGSVFNITPNIVSSQGNYNLWWTPWMPISNQGCGGNGSSFIGPDLCFDLIGCTGQMDVTSTTGEYSSYWSQSTSYNHGTGSPIPNVTPLQGTPYTFYYTASNGVITDQMPAGTYILRWLGGSYLNNYHNNSNVVFFQYVADFGNYSDGFVYEFSAKSGSTTASIRQPAWMFPAYSATQPNVQGLVQTSLIEAQRWMYGVLLNNATAPTYAGACCGVGFNHYTQSGVDASIKISLLDPIFTDDQNGSPSPSFQLIRVTKLPFINQAGSSACVTWNTVGVSATAVFQIDNASSYPAVNATVELLAQGGVTGSGLIQTGLTLNQGLNPITFSFDCPNTDVTATIQITIPQGACSGTNVSTLQFYLAPIIQFNNPLTYVYPIQHVQNCYYEGLNNIYVNNLGSWTVNNAVTTMSFVPPAYNYIGQSGPNNYCNTSSAYLTTTHTLNCNQSNQAIVGTFDFPDVAVPNGTGGNTWTAIVNTYGDQNELIYNYTYTWTD